MRTMFVISAAAAAVAAIAGGVWWISSGGTTGDPFAACRTSSVGTGMVSIGGPLSLIDENGKAVTEADVITKPTLVYFGYTYCPDVCPADNARTAEAIDLLAAQGHDVEMAMISVDPARDDPERMRDFTDYLHPRAVGYTGSMEQIQAAAAAYKVYFRMEENPDPDFYLVDHSTYTYLMLPETGFAEYFKRDVSPAEMAERVGCILGIAGGSAQ
ncbi:MAG: SCO family protein [Rhodobacterales bacterium]|nr:MAG: SCO family protein [Rhodobacterales bacterium]